MRINLALQCRHAKSFRFCFDVPSAGVWNPHFSIVALHIVLRDAVKSLRYSSDCLPDRQDGVQKNDRGFPEVAERSRDTLKASTDYQSWKNRCTFISWP